MLLRLYDSLQKYTNASSAKTNEAFPYVQRKYIKELDTVINNLILHYMKRKMPELECNKQRHYFIEY